MLTSRLLLGLPSCPFLSGFPPGNTASYEKLNPSLVLCAVFRNMVTVILISC